MPPHFELERARSALAGLVLAGSFLAGCGQAGGDGRAGGGTTASEDGPGRPDAVADAPAPTEAEDLPDTIYYDLTRFAWYAHGEPLRFDGTDYVPGGAAVAASAQDMERVGTYQGVALYRWTDVGEDVLYVPVFEGYWLPFVRAGVPGG